MFPEAVDSSPSKGGVVPKKKPRKAMMKQALETVRAHGKDFGAAAMDIATDMVPDSLDKGASHIADKFTKTVTNVGQRLRKLDKKYHKGQLKPADLVSLPLD